MYICIKFQFQKYKKNPKFLVYLAQWKNKLKHP